MELNLSLHFFQHLLIFFSTDFQKQSQMKRWQIVYVLPLEVWMDIFCFPWISRQEFGQLVERIGNFKFAEHAQFYLHEWGKRNLCKLDFVKDGLCKYINYEPYRLEIPQSPMPENIKFLDFMEISHFDAQTIDFLGKIRPLLTDLLIIIGEIPTDCLEALRTILANLAPMLNGIRSVYCGDESTLPMVREHFFQDTESLSRLRMLEINSISDTVSEMEQQENANFIMNWLTQPEDNDGPRLCEIHSENDFAKQISVPIREQFLAAKTPRTFAVNFVRFIRRFEFAEFHLENSIGEELHGKWTKIDEEEAFQITRHRAGWKTKETQEWIDGITKGGDWHCIWIDQPTIGSLDAAPQMDVQPVNETQSDQQPSTSKDV